MTQEPLKELTDEEFLGVVQKDAKEAHDKFWGKKPENLKEFPIDSPEFLRQT